MNALKKKIRKTYASAMTLIIMLVVGVVMIIAGAVCLSISKLFWIMLGLGIAFCVIGFYSIPFAWTNYGKIRANKPIMDLIEKEHFYFVSQIAAQLGKSQKLTLNMIKSMIRKGYLKTIS